MSRTSIPTRPSMALKPAWREGLARRLASIRPPISCAKEVAAASPSAYSTREGSGGTSGRAGRRGAVRRRGLPSLTGLLVGELGAQAGGALDQLLDGLGVEHDGGQRAFAEPELALEHSPDGVQLLAHDLFPRGVGGRDHE